jgi:hypothetical protein
VNTVVNRGHPYSGESYSEEGRTNIGTIYGASPEAGKKTTETEYAWGLFLNRTGVFAETEMDTMMEKFSKNIKIK